MENGDEPSQVERDDGGDETEQHQTEAEIPPTPTPPPEEETNKTVEPVEPEEPPRPVLEQSRSTLSNSSQTSDKSSKSITSNKSISGSSSKSSQSSKNGFIKQQNKPPPPPRTTKVDPALVDPAMQLQPPPTQIQQQPRRPSSGSNSPAGFSLKIGLANSVTGRYLTAEKFNNRLNVLGQSLKQRQQWTLECSAESLVPDEPAADVVYLKSAGGMYLSANIKGSVKCESSERCPETKFFVEFERNSDDNSVLSAGRWAFRSVATGAYLGVWSQKNNNKLQDQADTVQCRIDRVNLVGDSEMWFVQLSGTPLVHLKNFGRSRYCHLSCSDDAFACNDVIPWGERPIFLLEFFDGKYAIRSAANGKYLHRDGTLEPCLSPDTMFSLEFKTGVSKQQLNGVVFRDVTGACLCASGVGTLRSSSRKSITKEELFAISDSHPQITLINVANQKYCSIKQGMDVSANQRPLEPDDEEESLETFVPYSNNEVFQIEIDKSTCHWTFLSSQGKFWKLQGQKAPGVTASGDTQWAPETLFDATWHEKDGSVSFIANNGCLVKANPTGALQASCPGQQEPTERERFFLDIINRPLTVFRGCHGFIGLLPATSKSTSQRLDCSRVSYDVFELVSLQMPATYAIRLVRGKFWRVGADSAVVADVGAVSEASWFRFEFRRQGRAAIRHVQSPSGDGLCYLVGEGSGIVLAKGRDVTEECLWEM